MQTHTRTHTHVVHLAVSVGPVRGAAVARLVDLALLLQAAGLAPLARTTLNTHRHSACKKKPLSYVNARQKSGESAQGDV